MSEARNPGKPQRPATRPANVARPAAAQNDPGSVVAWRSGSGKSVSYHIVHVGPEGLTCGLYLGEKSHLNKLMSAVDAQPNDAASIIGAQKKALRLPREKLSRVAFTQKLKQLIIVDDAGKKHDVPAGDDGDQAQIFEAVNAHLGGKASEEEADAWSVIKVSLFAILVTIFAGGVFTKLAADANPNFVPAGRHKGLQQLINDLGMKLGPVWVGVIFAAVAIAIATPMLLRLRKRPTRRVLYFD